MPLQPCHRRASGCGPWALRLVVLLFNLCRLTHAVQAVVEGDTSALVFVNSVFMAPDRLGVAVLPMNGVRRFPVFSAKTEVVPIRGSLAAGDVVGIQVVSSRPEYENLTDPLGETLFFPAWAGVIAAFDDGIMTSNEWRCAEDPLPAGTGAWHSRSYNDSSWAAAVEHNRSCCAWRDPEWAWRGLAARWIGILRSNATGPRQIYCRYRVPDGGRLPLRLAARSSPDVPKVNVAQFIGSMSQILISFTVDREAYVTCAVVDARFELRVPIHDELLRQGSTAGPLSPNGTVWRLQGQFFTDIDFVTTALSWHSVTGGIQECEGHCTNNPDCRAITFYEAGFDLLTGANCKLVTGFNLTQTEAPSDVYRFTHKYIEEVAVIHTIVLTGIYLPATIYNAYCSAQDPITGLHSTWEAIATQYIANRTAGCLDCGDTSPPNVTVRGGYAAQTELTAVMSSSKAGRIFCRAEAVPVPAGAFSPANIKAAANGAFLIQAGSSVPVRMLGLSPSTQYEMACLADSDGGFESTVENIETTRREWSTEAVAPPITSMTVGREVVDGVLTVNSFVQMSTIGLLWCQVFPSNETRPRDPASNVTNNTWGPGLPRASWLRTNGRISRVETLAQETASSYNNLDPNFTYEVYCTAEETLPSNNSGGGDGSETAYPATTILSVNTSYDIIDVLAVVDKGPAVVFCLAKLQALTTQGDTAPPVQIDMLFSPYRVEVPQVSGGIVRMEILAEYIGSLYDIYCYSEEPTDLPPPGSEVPPRPGMDNKAIKDTRWTVRTIGATYKNDGWLCSSGYPCTLTDEREDPFIPLAASHRILVRSEPCPGRCFCNVVEDGNNKGAFCSPVSHDPRVAAPFISNPDVVEQADPRGAWCYVDQGMCTDQEPSPTFPSLWISYDACLFNLTAGRPGTGPVGFPNEGMAHHVGSNSFSWGSSNVMAMGFPYYICWCDVLLSPCEREVDFRLPLGRLHIAGPFASEQIRDTHCVAGLPCERTHFSGHAMENGARLALLPDTALGCEWVKEYPLDPPGVPGIPSGGVSLPAVSAGTTYSWGTTPVLAAGGRYILCWCGATRLQPGLGGGITCPPERPEGGHGFLVRAGYLSVIGPVPPTTPFVCSLGVPCHIIGVQGLLVQGGDRISVSSETCGTPSPLPEGWDTTIEAKRAAGEELGWLAGGWLEYGPGLSGCVLRSLGAPVATTCGGSDQGPPDFSDNSSFLPRGVLGFPNNGISQTSTKIGDYTWASPIWAVPDDYRLCWCSGRAPACDQPEHFNVFLGNLQVLGPLVLPQISQVYTCIRGRACEVRGFQGRLPINSQLFITAGTCGNPAPTGVPNDGYSLPSTDGSWFRWGSDAILVEPAMYRLCWCEHVGSCTSPTAFGAFSGILEVKGLLGNNLHVYCTLGQPCPVSGFLGQGLERGDEIRVLTICGHGQTPDGFDGDGKAVAQDDGRSIVVPPTRLPGVHNLCWCPAGNAQSDLQILCSRPEDYMVSLGIVEFGGPKPGSHYICYEWQPCAVSPLRGTALHDGDRLLVAPPGTDCATQGGLPFRPLLQSINVTQPPYKHPSGRRRRFPQGTPQYFEFPRLGVTEPATGNGTEYSWGVELVRSPPAIYTLCWCNHMAVPGGCTENGPFLVPAGSLRVGTYREFAYLNRPPDPAPRSLDQGYAIGMSFPLALVFYLIICPTWPFASKPLQRFDANAQRKGSKVSQQPSKTKADSEGDEEDSDEEVATLRRKKPGLQVLSFLKQGVRAAVSRIESSLSPSSSPSLTSRSASPVPSLRNSVTRSLTVMSFLSPRALSPNSRPSFMSPSEYSNDSAMVVETSPSQLELPAHPVERVRLRLPGSVILDRDRDSQFQPQLPNQPQPPPPKPPMSAQAHFGEYKRHSQVQRILAQS